MSGDGPLSIDLAGHMAVNGSPHWRFPSRTTDAISDQLDRARRCAEAEAENARLRAELARKPDLTELRELMREWSNGAGNGNAVITAVRRLLAADTAPAPDTGEVNDG